MSPGTIARLNRALRAYDAGSALAELRAAAREQGIDSASIASNHASLADILRIVKALGLQLHGAKAHV